MRSSLADFAAALGLPCFPCDGNKRPFEEGGFHTATTDLAEIDRRFSDERAKMIGVPTGRATGWVVIDIDVKNGARGLEWFEEHQTRLPSTRTHRTASKGLHLVLRMPEGLEIRNSAGRIAPGVDVRGEGGYVIVPPSPGYRLEDDSEPAHMPEWLIELCMPPPPPPRPEFRRVPPGSAASGDGTPYGLAALEAECDAIVNAVFGTQEHNLNSGSLKIGGLAAGGELAPDFALSRLLAAGRAMPSQAGARAWSPREVEQKIRRAFEDGMRQPRTAPPNSANGAHSAHGAEWREYGANSGEDRREYGAKEPPPRDDIFPTLGLDDLVDLPPPQWLIGKLVTTGSNVVIYGPYASLKSFVVLDMSLCIAFGREWQGRPVKQCGVLFVAGEGLAGFARRVRAWRQHHGLLDSPAPFRLLHVPVNITDRQDVERLILTAKASAEAEGIPIGLIVIDTLARAMIGADENSAQDMGRAVAATDSIRAGVETTTVSIHHTGKDSDRGPRGSNALPGAADTLIRVERDELSVTLTVEKQKEDEEGDPIVLKAEKVALGQGADGEPLSSLVFVGEPGQAGQLPGQFRQKRKLSGDTGLAFKMLCDEIAERGEVGLPGAPPEQSSVPEAWWRERFYQRCKPGADQYAKRKSFRRAADYLIENSLVAVNRGSVWPI